MRKLTKETGNLMRNELDKKKSNKSFDAALLKSVDEAFSALGKHVKDTLYSNLETIFYIKKQDIPLKIDEFSGALERIFGQASKTIEILIVKRLHERTSYEYTWEGPDWLLPNLTFAECIALARGHYDASGKSKKVEFGLLLNKSVEEVAFCKKK
jgi:hypothetical protein